MKSFEQKQNSETIYIQYADVFVYKSIFFFLFILIKNQLIHLITVKIHLNVLW